MSYHTLNRQAIANTIGALGTAANLDFTNVIGDSNDLPVSSAVRDAIDEAISSVYKPKGSKTVSEMTSALLISSNKGNVYNMSTNGTTTSDFVEGAGKEINIGDNVVIVEISQGVYKFDLLAGMVDLTNYYTRTDTDGLLNNKVDKVTGKQLSTEDYTTAEKTKLSGVEDGAEVNVIEDVKVNGTSQQITSKSVDLLIPTALSDLSDDSTHRVVTDTEKTTWNGKSVVTANPTTTSSDPDLSSLGINGTNYNIQGGDSSSASNVSYDNTTSGMSATNVQDAIDALQSETNSQLEIIQEQITDNIEDGATASRTYNAGEYIVRGGVYYKVKTTIASGTSFVVGTNIEETSVGDEISTINNNLTNILKYKIITGTTDSQGLLDTGLSTSQYTVIACASTNLLGKALSSYYGKWYAHFSNTLGVVQTNTLLSATVFFLSNDYIKELT